MWDEQKKTNVALIVTKLHLRGSLNKSDQGIQ